MLGKALGARRKDVVVSTKCGFRSGEPLLHQGLSRQHILASAEGSLKRLGTDYIDVYLVHRVDPHTPVEETVDALDDLVRQGKVRYVGFSNWPAWMAATAVGLQKQHNYARFRAAEMYYSLVGRDVEYDIVPFLENAGIGMMVWSPLAGGFLTGKYTRENPQGDGGRLTGFDMLPYDREKGHTVVDKLREIAQGAQCVAGADRAGLAAAQERRDVHSGRREQDGAAGGQPGRGECATLRGTDVPARRAHGPGSALSALVHGSRAGSAGDGSPGVVH